MIWVLGFWGDCAVSGFWVVVGLRCDMGFGFLGWLCREWVLGCGGFAGMVVVGLGLPAWVCGGGGSYGL